MSVFNKYFYENKKSKLYFGNRVVSLNDLFYEYGGSKFYSLYLEYFMKFRMS
jgi:hypothetical protein